MQENADVDLLKEGDFIAVELENYHRTPVIGKVFEVDEDGFVICYCKGSYNKEWTPHMPKSCILCVSDLRWMTVRSFYRERSLI